jgi:FkbM family methyltransferase
MKNIYLNQLKRVEHIAQASKWQRCWKNPLKYFFAIGFNNIFYPFFLKKIIVRTKVFFGETMTIALPASTDIFLTQGKSHDSEIRLVKFLIHQLKEGDNFLDIGAHYGFFSLLAARLVGKNGSVKSYEPTLASFELLQKNAKPFSAIAQFNSAVSSSTDDMVFYEFANLQSEYNSSNAAQFETEHWYKKSPPKKIKVAATTLDLICASEFCPSIIKIDVEGGEQSVIQGGLNFFKANKTIVVMEYLSPNRRNESHKAAVDLLKSCGYETYIISALGAMEPVGNIDDYLIHQGLDSDNIVMMKE